MSKTDLRKSDYVPFDWANLLFEESREALGLAKGSLGERYAGYMVIRWATAHLASRSLAALDCFCTSECNKDLHFSTKEAEIANKEVWGGRSPEPTKRKIQKLVTGLCASTAPYVGREALHAVAPTLEYIPNGARAKVDLCAALHSVYPNGFGSRELGDTEASLVIQMEAALTGKVGVFAETIGENAVRLFYAPWLNRNELKGVGKLYTDLETMMQELRTFGIQCSSLQLMYEGYFISHHSQMFEQLFAKGSRSQA